MRSASISTANTNVPATKPSITADVTRLMAYWFKPSACFSSGNTALPANHKEVPANCANTMMGSTLLDFSGSRVIVLCG